MTYKIPKRLKKDREYTEKKYICGYCNFEFLLDVASSGGGRDEQGNKIYKLTTQVQCPTCGNFLKTGLEQ